MENKKTLVASFLRAGENYAVGHIEKGNTHIFTEMIVAETGGELFHIRPVIQGDAAVEDYDIIFIGYSNWWGDMPMPVYTFIEKHDWQGKTVIPFCTHEGSGLSATENKLMSACKGATVRKGWRCAELRLRINRSRRS